MVRPWAEAGARCFCIDIQHENTTTEGNITFIGADILQDLTEWMPNLKVDLGFAFPPCTHTAISGARHFKTKGATKAAEAFTLIARCQQVFEWIGCPYLWEQPISTASTYCGPPNHIFNPFQFAGYAADPEAEAYTKRTCIWSKGIEWPEPRPVEPIRVCEQGSWVQRLGGGGGLKAKNRRSETPHGFAMAIFEANKHLMKEDQC